MESDAAAGCTGRWSPASIRLCRRCGERYARVLICDPCLQAADADIAEKRGILLHDPGHGDALSAVA